MSQEAILTELLLRWDELATEGPEPSVEELCHDCPELAPELARRIRIMQRWDAARKTVTEQTVYKLGADGPDSAARSLPRVQGYEVLEKIGQGGMGVVYRARQLSLGRVAALKRIRSDLLAEPADRQRFHNEARAIAAIEHPGIVEVYEFGTDEGTPFIALEFCAGGTLAERLAGAPLPAREAAHVGEQLGRAVQAAHAAGVVHRDLKPANVLLQKKSTTDNTDNTDGKERRSSSSVSSVLSVVGFVPKITDLGPEHEQTLASLHLHGVALVNSGRAAEGRQVLGDALPKYGKVLGEEHPATLFRKHNLAFSLFGLGEFARADPLVREVIASRIKILGPEHRDTLASQALLVALIAFRKQGYPEGEQLGQECLPVTERELGPGHPRTINFRQNLASIFLQQNKCPEALRVAWRLLEAGRDDDVRAVSCRVQTLRSKANRPDHPVDLQASVLLAWAEHRAGKTAVAEKQLLACLAEGRKRLSPGHWLLGLVEVLLGDCLTAQKRHADAEPLVLSGYEALQKAIGTPGEQLREAHARLVALYEAWGRPEAVQRWKKPPPLAGRGASEPPKGGVGRPLSVLPEDQRL